MEYRSVDQRGDSIVLSGKVFIPKGKAKQVVLIPHFTIAADKEVPSNCTPMEATFLKKNYILVMPDYLGYGASVDRAHPYLHGELTARNCADMLWAVQEKMEKDSIEVENDSLLIVGFSQGAATAMWTLRLLETEYAERVRISHCYAGSGPYDVASTYDKVIRDGWTGLALVVPMLVTGTSEAYGLNLDYETIFTPTLLKNYQRWIMAKKYDVISLALRMPYKQIDHWLTADGQDKTQGEGKRMYEGFMRSSLVFIPTDPLNIYPEKTLNWKPKTPITLFHSTTDDLVPYENADHLWTMLEREGVTPEIIFGDYGGHISSMVHFLRMVKKRL